MTSLSENKKYRTLLETANKLNDKIVFTKPRALRLYTGITTLPYTKKALDDSRYLLIEKHIFDFSNTVTNYENIFENEHFKLYLKSYE